MGSPSRIRARYISFHFLFLVGLDENSLPTKIAIRNFFRAIARDVTVSERRGGFLRLVLLLPPYVYERRDLRIFPGFDLRVRFLPVCSEHSISRGRISRCAVVDWLDGWLGCLLSRPIVLLFTAAGSSRSRIPRRRSVSLRMRPVAEEELPRNIGK